MTLGMPAGHATGTPRLNDYQPILALTRTLHSPVGPVAEYSRF